MSTVATPICSTDTRSWIPPHCTNSEIVSTSDVTRETSDPRRSVFWVSTERSCTCRNARTRRDARPASVALKSRTLTNAEHTPAPNRHRAAATTRTTTRATSGPPGARIPMSIVCWTAIGTTTRPTAARTASAPVSTQPSTISGETCTPRRKVASTPRPLVDAIRAPTSSSAARRPVIERPPGAASRAHRPSRARRSPGRMRGAPRESPGRRPGRPRGAPPRPRGARTTSGTRP